MLKKEDNVFRRKLQYQKLLSRLYDGGVKIYPRFYEEEKLGLTSENCTPFIVVKMGRIRKGESKRGKFIPVTGY
jgi:hypothetical protein